ncbi:glycoside hydrolase family 43 protein [Xylogone sp. PMI_703]|nr:glycoside hydrolase family 43 protein [Xylogone sp. PMI_703]
MFSSTALSLSLFSALTSASLQIVPGATWTAKGTNQHVQAHGGGINEVNGVYYWIGENKLNGSAFQSINCYSSTDLVQWTFVNELLTLQSSGDLGPNRVVERPHVLYNDQTKKYVMWMHIDSSSYGEAKAGVATSSSICGSYTYLGSSQPLGFQSRDLNVFKDTDGSGYLLTEDRANGLRIDKLSADYTSAASATFLYAQDYEAPALYKSGNTYFMFASHESGWSPNDNIYCTATKLTGPWSAWANFAPSGTNTYSSQTAAVVSVNGVVMYMGDRWQSSNLMTSTYVWLPLTISGTTATLHNEVNWILNVGAGSWAAGPSESTPEAESSSNTLANGAKVVSCSGCSGSKSIGYIGGSPGGTLTFNGVSSSASTTTTIRIHHTNGDSTQRYANVVVNGASYTVAFLPTTNDNTPGTSTLTVPLKSGSNTIEFEAHSGGWAANVDRLMVPAS